MVSTFAASQPLTGAGLEARHRVRPRPSGRAAVRASVGPGGHQSEILKHGEYPVFMIRGTSFCRLCRAFAMVWVKHKPDRRF